MRLLEYFKRSYAITLFLLFIALIFYDIGDRKSAENLGFGSYNGPDPPTESEQQ